MATFKTFLAERFINTFDAEVKRKYMQQVWDLLQKSYSYIGGIKGDEFETPEKMLAVPFWKLIIKDGKAICCILYKDNNGRKSIAFGTDGSREAKLEAKKLIKADLERSYKEVSGAAEKFMQHAYPELFKQYSIPADKVAAIIGKEIEPCEDGMHYKRMIHGSMITKILLGTPGNKFY
jgi:hypothetical protein